MVGVLDFRTKQWSSLVSPFLLVRMSDVDSTRLGLNADQTMNAGNGISNDPAQTLGSTLGSVIGDIVGFIVGGPLEPVVGFLGGIIGALVGHSIG